ncbi:hypothetical protein [Rickettsia endosymbiont of Ixodes pacificus]|uniref:hypothetical protein n=1 Tax=Rickettsia endosymbiont of Ixodes pacificus TaxID=1133329 RepID=UPI0018CCD37E|nr:hypothetical protein [Rickettsia endosymbiont of Ixodes pacificus]
MTRLPRRFAPRKALLRGSISPLYPAWLDHGIQLKILKLLVFLLFLWPPWSSHGVTQWVLPVHATMPCE